MTDEVEEVYACGQCVRV